MTPLKATLIPRTAFATPLMGDTLFGHLCWAIRHGWGEARLEGLLAGYTAGRPFLVVSDAFPAGHLPLPALPSRLWAHAPADPSQRKAFKRRVWLPEPAFAQPLAQWQGQAREPQQIGGNTSRIQAHNSLNRLTLTTGSDDGFAPYGVRQWWHSPGVALEVHLRLDESRADALGRAELAAALVAIGAAGFGRDASAGLGKFILEGDLVDNMPPAHDAPDAWLTLAPCAPQGLGFDPARSFYRPFNRYGRHGDEAARRETPFKAPLLLAAAGAVFVPLAFGKGPGVKEMPDWARGFIGQGLGGDGRLSSVLPQTVHQGYAPALPVRLPVAQRETA